MAPPTATAAPAASKMEVNFVYSPNAAPDSDGGVGAVDEVDFHL